VNKLFGVFLAAAVVVGLAPYARSSGPQFLPPGISGDNWITLGDRAGFVITNGDSLNGSTGAVGIAKGYFMLRRAGIWLRIDTSADYGGVIPQFRLDRRVW
jgi:hypothetical protein